MLIFDEDSYKIQFYNIDIDSEIKLNYQEMQFVKEEFLNLIVSQDISDNLNTVQGGSSPRIVVSLTKSDATRLLLLHRNESVWQHRYTKHNTDGGLLACFVTSETIFLVFQAHCTLMDKNLIEIKRLENMYPV